MLITKQFIKDQLAEACQLFNDNVYPIDNSIEVEFIDKATFLGEAKKNALIQQQISLGLYNYFDKEYPNFFVVYAYNKDPMRRALGLSYKVTVCFDMAKDLMKRFKPNQVKAYFLYAFIHEIGHIYEYKLIDMWGDAWEQALVDTNQDESLAKELFVDDLATGLVDDSTFTSINEELWLPVKRRAMQKLANMR